MGAISIGAWRPFMKQRVSVEALTGRDAYGAPTYGTAVTYGARVVGRRRSVLNAAGEEVVSSQTVYLASGDNVLPTARVTLSTGDVGSTESWALQPTILATGRYPDETGAMLYTALYL
jgi:UDP-N-acetylglucosamine enolpyruvyl transferase